jgi:methionine-rich copper-binding protein CopC
MVVLRDPSNVEALGLPNALTVTVQDRTRVPSIFVDNHSVTEGDTGSTTEALFKVSLSAATGRTVTANFATSNIIATGGGSCNNQGTDYETKSGTLTFQPGNTALTIPIKICGDSSAEANETVKVTLSDTANATFRSSEEGEMQILDEGIGTIVDDDVLELLLEESGPVVNQAAALDALLFLRDPFSVVGTPEIFASGPDRNTRVMFFVRNLQLNPGEGPSAVVVRLNSNFQLTDVPAQDVRPVPNVDFTQVIIRLPNNLLPGTYMVMIRAHTRSSNTGTIRIAP